MGLQAHECRPENNVASATGLSIMLLRCGRVPLCFFLAKGGFPPISTTGSRAQFSRRDEGASASDPAFGAWETTTLPLPLHKITPRRRTMRIVKPINKIAAGVEVASAFPGSITGICPVCTFLQLPFN
jgi:hypothetical protein